MTQRPAATCALRAIALLSVAFTVSAFAQSNEWKELRSEKGKFSALLPGDPGAPGHRPGPEDAGAAITYVTNYQKGAKAWSVDYFDLPAIPPSAEAAKKLLERRRDSYTARPKDQKSWILNDFPTLEFKEPLDDRDRVRVIRIILVKQRVYELWAVTQSNRSDSEDVSKFFDSFKPEPLTDDEVAEAAKAAMADKAQARPRKLTVSSGVLEGLAVKKVQPLYPRGEKPAGVSATVRVQILVSEEGNVIEAVIGEGHPFLREAALTAVRQWVFKPVALSGAPVRVAGVLNLKFTPR